MLLEGGLKLSTEIVKELQPYCECVCVAGSIRRRCEFVKDVDIVCIMKPGLGQWQLARADWILIPHELRPLLEAVHEQSEAQGQSTNERNIRT